jgi:hypothetical protein
VASGLYDDGREGFLLGEIRWNGTAVIKIALMRGGAATATALAGHKFMSDATGAGATIVGTPQTLGGQTATDGVADANDVTFTAVTAGAAIERLCIYQASAVTGGADVAANAQRLIALIDDYTGLPVTPNGGDIAVQFSAGANRIFKL